MDAIARIIDANANRAREGLRTLEDIARFALDDADLSGRAKALRHRLRAAIEGLAIGSGALLGARDTPGDVGTAITTAGERDRRGLAHVGQAAAARASEALRAIEELAKTLGREGGAPFEAMRYEVYELERLIVGGVLARPGQWALCVILTGELCRGRAVENVARRAIEGGADCLQVREKALGARAFVEVARRVVAAARPAGVPVIVNDRADVALAAGADGVHVGQGDLSIADARRVLGAAAIVGVSTSSMDDAARAIDDGASYCGLGSMFASSTKPKPTLAGVAYLRAYLGDERARGVPHLAIGGITPANAGELAAAGCRGVAVSGAVCRADDPARVCRALVDALRSG